MESWYLLTDRSLKTYRLYGPFPTAMEADELAVKLKAAGKIAKQWAVIIAEVPPAL